MAEVTRDEFFRAVKNEGLVPHEPIFGEHREHYGNAKGEWRGTLDNEGRTPRYYLEPARSP